MRGRRLNRAGDGLQELEDPFRESVEDLARRCGWLVYHTHDSRRSEPGYPDDVLLRDGVQIVFEAKSEDGKTTPDQDTWLEAYRQVPGCIVRVWRPSDWDEIERLLTAPRLMPRATRQKAEVTPRAGVTAATQRLARFVLEAVAGDGLATVTELQGRSRRQPLARERQIVMAVLREVTPDATSQTEIAEALDRNPSTVTHGLQAVEALERASIAVSIRIRRLAKDVEARNALERKGGNQWAT